MDKSILLKAVRADAESTPPGYIIEEIVRMSMQSDACYEIEEFLLRFLAQHYKQYDPYVKCKILKIIRHICESGNPQFRISLQRKATVLKAFLSYRAPLDPLRGDALNREVRDEADKCIKALYGNEAFSGGDSSLTQTSQFYRYDERVEQPDQSSSRIEGFGSESVSSVPITGMSSTMSSPAFPDASRRLGKMEGFGNPHFAYQNDPSREVRPQSVVDSVTEVVSVQAEHLVNGLSHAASSVSKYLPESLKTQIDAFGERFSLPSSHSSSSWSSSNDWKKSPPSTNPYSFSGHLSGNDPHALSNFSSSSYSPPHQQRQYVPSSSSTFHRPTSSLSHPPIQPTGTSLPSPARVLANDTSSSLSSSIYQQQSHSAATASYVEFYSLISLIETVCSSTISSKPGPTRSSLAEFVRKVNLDAHSSSVIKVLLAKLSSNPDFPSIRPATTWQAKYRVICCLSALIDPSLNLMAESRESFERSLKSSGCDSLSAVRRTTPKCRGVVDELLDKLHLEPSSSSTAFNSRATSSADYLIDSTTSADGSTLSESGGQDSQWRSHEAVTGDDLLGDLLQPTETNGAIGAPSNSSSSAAAVGLGGLAPSLLDDVLGFNATLDPSESQSSHIVDNSLQPTSTQSKTGLFSGLSLSTTGVTAAAAGGELLDMDDGILAPSNIVAAQPSASTTEGLFKDVVNLGLPKNFFGSEPSKVSVPSVATTSSPFHFVQ